MSELRSADRQILDTMLEMGVTAADIRLLHQLIEYSQTDYFYPEKDYPSWRDRVAREGREFAARLHASFSVRKSHVG